MSISTEEKIITTITVTEGTIARQYEQTASRDHNVTLIPGTYEVRAHYNPEKFLTRYTAAIPAIAHEHTRSTVEFGGVALAWEQRGGETETYGWSAYPYEIDAINARGNYTLS